MLVDLMKSNEKPLINFMEDGYYHISFLVNGIEATDYGIRDGSTYVLMVENSKLVLMKLLEYAEYIKSSNKLNQYLKKVTGLIPDDSIIYDCDDCGKEVEFGGGDDFFLEPPYYNVDYPKVVCGSCFSKNYLTSNEVKDLKICLHCHSRPDKEDKICKNCGCDDIVNESDLIY